MGHVYRNSNDATGSARVPVLGLATSSIAAVTTVVHVGGGQSSHGCIGIDQKYSIDLGQHIKHLSESAHIWVQTLVRQCILTICASHAMKMQTCMLYGLHFAIQQWHQPCNLMQTCFTYNLMLTCFTYVQYVLEAF